MGTQISRKQSLLTSLNKATVFFAVNAGAFPLPRTDCLSGSSGTRGRPPFCRAAPVLGSPRCYQELKSPKPALFFSFFAAVLVEGPSSSMLRFLEPKWKHPLGTVCCAVGAGQLAALPSLNSYTGASYESESSVRPGLAQQGWGFWLSAGMARVRLGTLPKMCSKPSKFSRSEQTIQQQHFFSTESLSHKCSPHFLPMLVVAEGFMGNWV